MSRLQQVQSALNLALLDTGLAASAQRASGHIERGTRTERGVQGPETLPQRKCPGGSAPRHQGKKLAKLTAVSRPRPRLTRQARDQARLARSGPFPT